MLDAFGHLLCFKLFRHNRPVPKRVCLESVDVEAGVSIFHNYSYFMTCETTHPQPSSETTHPQPSSETTHPQHHFLSVRKTVEAVEEELMHYGIY